MENRIQGFAPADVHSSSEQPRKSLVQVRFPGRGIPLAYYNSRFDLHPGDRVYVSGKLSGQLGQVVEVQYNFKIRISDYQTVIGRCDTRVSGQFFLADSHFVTFDPAVLSRQQITGWFLAPELDEEEYAWGYDDSAFPLDDLSQMGASDIIAQRGQDYYRDNRVRYLCLDGAEGFAIVDGTVPYTVEFTCSQGQISQLVCSCPCGYCCKHEVAAMLQLQEALDNIQNLYPDAYAKTGYFAAVFVGTLFQFTVGSQQMGSLVLNPRT